MTGEKKRTKAIGGANDVLTRIKRGQTGMRALLLDDLRQDRVDYPRLLSRAVGPALKTGCRRPVFAIHQVARLAEHYLHKARYGRGSYRRFLGEAEKLILDVREDIRFLVRDWAAGEKPGAVQSAFAASRARAYLERLRSLDARFHMLRQTPCPCCLGSGRLFDSVAPTATTVKTVLDFAVQNGILRFDPRYGYYAASVMKQEEPPPADGQTE